MQCVELQVRQIKVMRQPARKPRLAGSRRPDNADTMGHSSTVPTPPRAMPGRVARLVTMSGRCGLQTADVTTTARGFGMAHRLAWPCFAAIVVLLEIGRAS